MIERYITGLAFVLGGFGFLAILSMFSPTSEDDNTNRDVFVYLGLLSWAWLIARYFL